MSQIAPLVRRFAAADQPKLKAMAEAIRAAGVQPRQYALRSEPQADILFLVAETQDRLLGSVMALPSPGAMAMVLSPLSVRPQASRPSVEDALLVAAAAELRAEKQKIAYAVFPAEAEAAEADPFLRHGYRPITELIYLEQPLKTLPKQEPIEGLRLIPFAEQPQRFADTLHATYEGSLDCPEMDGLRTINEVLKGHACTGVSGVARWRLIEQAGSAVGVQMTAEIDEEAALDLVYFGLVPAARGQGLGRKLLAQLLHETKKEGWRRITLSVDARNAPALALYARHGFNEYDRRRLALLDLNSRAAPPAAT